MISLVDHYWSERFVLFSQPVINKVNYSFVRSIVSSFFQSIVFFLFVCHLSIHSFIRSFVFPFLHLLFSQGQAQDHLDFENPGYGLQEGGTLDRHGSIKVIPVLCTV